MNYSDFLASKAMLDPMTGIAGDVDLPSVMFPFQRDVVAWALKRGRGALFEGTGLGKSLQELAWGEQVAKETRRQVIHFAPLAVTAQMQREAVKFGVEPQTIINYQRMSHYDIPKAGGVILDESSILKSVDGHFRTALIKACADVPFRLAATATPAPNDFMELGNHAEFLGVMSYTDMLATFFVHDGGDTQKWRLKGHAENEFWKWMASWAVMIRQPSDLGYSNEGYDLPPLHYHNHVVDVDHDPSATGTLFAIDAQSLSERIIARRTSVDGRVNKAIETTPDDMPFVWWCNLNAESEALAKGIPGAVEVRGSDSEESKERKLIDFSEGRIRVLVTKPSICGFGMNWQHCAETGFVGLNDSFEQFYQSVRRFWRFGQKRQVNCHIISAKTEGAVIANIRRKEADAERMAAAMVMHMKDFSVREVRGLTRDDEGYTSRLCNIPLFLRSAPERSISMA